MIKIISFLLLIFINTLMAQQEKPFSKFDVGFYGGINFYNIENSRGSFFVEVKTNLISSLKMKISTGYHRTIQPKSYTVRKYSENLLDTIPRFFASKYNVVSKNYNVFPLTIGIQYCLVQSMFSPYISLDLVYNYINTALSTSSVVSWNFGSLNEIPVEFRERQKIEKFPNNSYGVIFGAGSAVPISSKLNIDLRYFFKYDNKVIGSHHFIVGLYF